MKYSIVVCITVDSNQSIHTPNLPLLQPNMSLLALATRAYTRRATTSIATSSSSSIFLARSHSVKAVHVEVDHLVSGWNKDEVEKYKNETDKFCVVYFNKISSVVS